MDNPLVFDLPVYKKTEIIKPDIDIDKDKAPPKPDIDLKNTPPKEKGFFEWLLD